jgi:hypothetical protein
VKSIRCRCEMIGDLDAIGKGDAVRSEFSVRGAWKT